MKRRDIILDFTSLLDVTLILIFFFVIFGNLQITEVNSEVQDVQKEAEVKVAEAEALMLEVEELQKLLGEELNSVKQADGRQGENIEGLLEYNSSVNLKIMLDVENEGSWKLKIYQGEKKLDEITPNNDIVNDLVKIIQMAGYTSEDTLICDYIYDASQPGSLSAYRAVDDALKEIKNSYSYFYYSETDISLKEE